jgi:hypothetical protein
VGLADKRLDAPIKATRLMIIFIGYGYGQKTEKTELNGA